jgi:prepilin-type N-terminal cleavage/methylation domain-containing protein
MKTMRALVGNQRGFTLVEMLVATAIMGFVLSAALLAVQAGTQASDVTTGRAEAQSSIRFALDRMIADMRAAGYNPTLATFDPIDSGSMNSFTVMLNTDLNGNGTLDAPVGTCDAAAQAERVRYRKSGTSLMRAVMTNATTVACETTLIGGVQSLTFTYRGPDDSATGTTSATVRTIEVALTIQPESMGSYKVGTMAAAMTDRARLRNR